MWASPADVAAKAVPGTVRVRDRLKMDDNFDGASKQKKGGRMCGRGVERRCGRKCSRGKVITLTRVSGNPMSARGAQIITSPREAGKPTGPLGNGGGACGGGKEGAGVRVGIRS